MRPIVRGEDNKDHMLFPRKVNGASWPSTAAARIVWIAWSDDLLNWPESDMAKVFGPREEIWWDNASVGGNGVPIETDHGWLAFYHAYDKRGVYRPGRVAAGQGRPD